VNWDATIPVVLSAREKKRHKTENECKRKSWR
jgi:hypothetical protein